MMRWCNMLYICGLSAYLSSTEACHFAMISVDTYLPHASHMQQCSKFDNSLITSLLNTNWIKDSFWLLSPCGFIKAIIASNMIWCQPKCHAVRSIIKRIHMKPCCLSSDSGRQIHHNAVFKVSQQSSTVSKVKYSPKTWKNDIIWHCCACGSIWDTLLSVF